MKQLDTNKSQLKAAKPSSSQKPLNDKQPTSSQKQPISSQKQPTSSQKQPTSSQKQPTSSQNQPKTYQTSSQTPTSHSPNQTPKTPPFISTPAAAHSSFSLCSSVEKSPILIASATKKRRRDDENLSVRKSLNFSTVNVGDTFDKLETILTSVMRVLNLT
jgi:hypothetical protein